ncbi:MAG: glycosyltransferase family 39 protein [Chloroflexota bacterium]|nr:glycosyltransferase family 39 protein [Chloroflexota bacterium]
MQVTQTNMNNAVARTAGSEASSATRSVSKEGLRLALIVWFVLRLLLSAWGMVSMLVANPQTYANAKAAYPEIRLPEHDLYGLTVGVWNIYDTRHYITIAEKGYMADTGWLPAYFPGYPLLIKALSPLLLGDSLLAALLIANVCAFLVFWYLYRLVEPEYGRDVARRSMILCAVFPASFFLFVGYSEAPVLAFSLMALYYAKESKWWMAGIMSGAAAFTKQPGILLVLPLAYLYWRYYREATAPRSLSYKLNWLWLLLAPLATGAYTLYRYLFIKAPITSATDAGGAQRFDFPGLPLLRAFQAANTSNPVLAFNIMEILSTILLIVLVVGVVLRGRSWVFSIYAAVMAIANLSISMWVYYQRPEVNMPRRDLLVFPIFICMALVTRSERLFKYVVAVSFLMFLGMSALFVQWVFVG